MQESYLIQFAYSRPFEPFSIFLTDARRIDVTHPESIIVAECALSLWIFHPERHVEVVDAATITSLKTLGPVDPLTFMR